MDFQELEEKLAFDRHALDVALIEQPELYYHTSKGFALAMSVRDAAKDELKQAFAEFGLSIREEAVESGEKMTEGKLESLVLATPEYQDLQNDLIKKNLELQQWQALKEAFDMRSHSLREVAKLTVTNFLGEQSAAGAATTEESEEILKEKRKEVNEKQKRKPVRRKKRTRQTQS